MESKIEQCKTRANEALASMNKKLVKEMLSQKESLTQTKAVFGALYLFLGLHKPTEIKNFIQKLTMGGLYLVSYLKDINLKKVPVSNIQDAESALSEVSEDELQSELETAYHLYQWLSNTIEVYITQMQLEQEVNAQAMEELDKVVTQELDNSVIQDAKKVVTERTNHLASQETVNTLQANEYKEKMEEDKEEKEENNSVTSDKNQAPADIFKNNHDLIGVEGIIESQKHEIEKTKLELRMENEHYLRLHPEINSLISLFVRKVLDERPEHILMFAGSFFDRAELKQIVEDTIERDREEQTRNRYLNDLMQGKIKQH